MSASPKSDAHCGHPTEIGPDLREWRRELGREELPFEVRVIMSRYPDRDMVNRYEEAGATSIHLPSYHAMGLDNPSLQKTKDKLSRLGEDIQMWKKATREQLRWCTP